MKAIVYHDFKGPLSVENVSDPIPKADGVVVKVSATGLCRSDWHGWMGHDTDITLPHVPGHELAGIVEEVGSDVQQFKRGDRVTVPFVCGCGVCQQCNTGNQQVCDNQSQPGFTHWGSFAEYVSLDYADTNLVKIPAEIDDATAAILGCRFVTSFRAIVDQGNVFKGDIVAIHGCGGVGLSAIMIAKALDALVIAIDINENTLRLAKELGADFTINAQGSDVISEIKSISKVGVQVSVDALGSQATCFNSIACLRKRGRHVQVGLMTGDHQQPQVPMDLVLANELEIFGSHGMQASKYPRMLQMIVDGTLKPQRLINRTISLKEATTALPNMDKFDHSGALVINTF